MHIIDGNLIIYTKQEITMNKKSLTYMRNIGIVAHIDAGKTTTTERILYYTGLNHKIGEVHDGSTITDYMEQERERGITITSAAVTCTWKKRNDPKSKSCMINIIDTPGHVDFTIEVERTMRILDGAITIFDGVAGVEPQSETVWRQANRYNVPRICFINKLDRIGSNFFNCVNMIKNQLNTRPSIICLPIGKEEGFKGIVDLITIKEITWKNDELGSKYNIDDISIKMKNQAQKYREKLLEDCADCDDLFAEKYLDEKEITKEDILRALRIGTINGKIVPICCGSAFKNKGIQFLLDSIIDFLPSPVDISSIKGFTENGKQAVRKSNNSEPLSSLAFKIINDKYGQLTFLRIYSGILKKGMTVKNMRNGKTMRIGRLVRMFADKREDINEIGSGGIGAAIGIDASTGDTFCDKNFPIILESMDIPPSVITLAIEPKSKDDQEKMSTALHKLIKEDPSLRLKIDKDTGQTIIEGMGELHLEISIERLKREFALDVSTGKPQVAYRETITKSIKQEGKYIRQSGGRGQYGHVMIKIKPNNIGKGFEFTNKIVGGSIPKEYIPAIKKGIEESLNSGIKAGFPIVDVKVILYDGSYHNVDSSDIAFKIAAAIAFREACKKAYSIILEPIMKAEIITPEQWMGDVIGDINSKRGKIKQMIDRYSSKVIKAEVPLSEMFGYSNDLRSKTQGRAIYSMEFSHYTAVPSQIADKIIIESETV